MATNAAKGKVPKLSLGDRLRLAREHAHIGSTEMAQHLKCSRHSITNAERGRTTPNYSTLVRWSEITRYDLSWLLDGQIEVDTIDEAAMREQLAQSLVKQLLGDRGEQRSSSVAVSIAEEYLAPDDYIDITREPAVVRHLAPTG